MEFVYGKIPTLKALVIAVNHFEKKTNPFYKVVTG